MSIKIKFGLHVEEGEAGLWYVTSPDVKGLFIAGQNMPEALAAVPGALTALLKAHAHIKQENGS